MSPHMKKDEDLFNQSSMSFGEHLIELRRCLINSILWLTLAFIVAMIPLGSYPSLSSLTVDYIQHPLKKSLENFYTERAQKRINSEKDYLKSIGYQGDAKELINKYQMTAEEYWVFPDQNGVLLDAEGKPVATAAVEIPSNKALGSADLDKTSPTVAGQNGTIPTNNPSVVKDPSSATSTAADSGQTSSASANSDKKTGEFANNSVPAADKNSVKSSDAFPKPQRVLLWKKFEDDSRLKTKALNMPETFVIFLKAAVFLALVLASPGVFYNFWSFVAAGLYERERKLVYRFLPLSLILFVAGFCMAFFVVFEMVLTFLLKFNASMNIDPDPRISEWLNLALLFPIAFGIAFQLPLVMFALCRLRIISYNQYCAHWKISVLTISFLSMMFTPPDPWSFTCLFLSVVMLYFGGILLCKMFPPPKRAFIDDDDPKEKKDSESESNSDNEEAGSAESGNDAVSAGETDDSEKSTGSDDSESPVNDDGTDPPKNSSDPSEQ